MEKNSFDELNTDSENKIKSNNFFNSNINNLNILTFNNTNEIQENNYITNNYNFNQKTPDHFNHTKNHSHILSPNQTRNLNNFDDSFKLT